MIENVENVRHHLIDPVRICGTSFGLGVKGTTLQRHRYFETSFRITGLPCQHDRSKPTIGIYGGHGRNRKRAKGANHQSGTNFDVDNMRKAMGMPWATTAELSEAIPPVYSEFIARQWLMLQRLASAAE